MIVAKGEIGVATDAVVLAIVAALFLMMAARAFSRIQV